MGAGKSGIYSNTYGSLAVPGSVDYMSFNDNFSKFIRKRKDIDRNGFYDVIAHGTSTTIEIQNNGISIEIDHRMASKIFKKNSDLKNKSIRLFSCDTGAESEGFAQNLANKLNVIVEAPTKKVWVYPNGRYFVAGSRQDAPKKPDYSNRGCFKKFYPGGKQ
ncbi:hypothetical protein IJT93_00795 [bacterium]|nr:hypothetical protein [bacterium]